MSAVEQEPGDDSPGLVGERKVEIVALGLLLAFALLMAWDNWKTGIRWESTGPQAGYFPFYVSSILAAACAFGLVAKLRRLGQPESPFVLVSQFKRVLQVFLPSLAFVPITQYLGIYVSSFALISGFMFWVGRIKAWKCLVTALVFTVAMFVLFDVAFDVIMPKGPLERLFGY